MGGTAAQVGSFMPGPLDANTPHSRVGATAKEEYWPPGRLSLVHLSSASLPGQRAVHLHRTPLACPRLRAARFKTRAGGRQAAEARLETKSHRRVSRRSVKQELSELAKGLERDEDEE